MNDITKPTMIIDPPVGPFSSVQDLEDWLTELDEMPGAPEVIEAMEQAEGWLANVRKRAET